MSIYFIRYGGTGHIKIGHAADVAKRFKDLQCASPEELTLLAVMDGDRETEANLHQQFKHLRVVRRGRREWFRLEPEMEEYLTKLSPPKIRPQSPYKSIGKLHHLRAAWMSNLYETDDEMAWIFGMDADMLRDAYGPSGRPAE